MRSVFGFLGGFSGACIRTKFCPKLIFSYFIDQIISEVLQIQKNPTVLLFPALGIIRTVVQILGKVPESPNPLNKFGMVLQLLSSDLPDFFIKNGDFSFQSFFDVLCFPFDHLTFFCAV